MERNIRVITPESNLMTMRNFGFSGIGELETVWAADKLLTTKNRIHSRQSFASGICLTGWAENSTLLKRTPPAALVL